MQGKEVEFSEPYLVPISSSSSTGAAGLRADLGQFLNERTTSKKREVELAEEKEKHRAKERERELDLAEKKQKVELKERKQMLRMQKAMMAKLGMDLHSGSDSSD